MPIMERYLYASGSQPPLDSGGLLSSSVFGLWSDFTSISLSEASKIPCGILVAEGGMGKTVFMDQLANFSPDQTVLLKVEEYQSDISAFATALKTAEKTILVDGLDENPEATTGLILRFLRDASGAKIWIATRNVAAIRRLQSEFNDLPIYHLAPLSRDNLCSYGGQGFLDAVTQQGLLPLCAKPLGCSLASKLFSTGQLSKVTQQEFWNKGIKVLCEQSQKLSLDPFSAGQIFQCAAWIALCSTLTGKQFIWDETTGALPDNCLSCEELLNGGNFSLDLIRGTLKRGLFRPLGDGSDAFFHNAYRDYLAAYAFNTKIPPSNWDAVLFNEQRNIVWPSLAGLATWLAVFNAEFRSKLLAVQPEILLTSDESIQSIGPSKLCSEILRRANCLSHQQRNHANIISNLHRLKGQNTANMLNQHLLDPKSASESIEIAIRIIMACQYAELASLLADRALNTTVKHTDRVFAAYALSTLQDSAANEQLKTLLPVAPESDPDDELLGAVLLACWPTHIKAEELVTHLVQPQNTSLLGKYRHFIHKLEENLEKEISLDNAPIFLQWAMEHLASAEWRSLTSLAQSIYTVCWKWAQYPKITQLLGKGYSKAIAADQSPVHYKETHGSHAKCYISNENFQENVDSRLAVLECILLSTPVSTDDIRELARNDCSLFSAADLPHLFGKALDAHSQGGGAEPWIYCINSVLPAEIGPYAEQINGLHALYPSLIKKDVRIAADRELASIKYQKMQRERERRQLVREEKKAETQHEIDKGVSKELDDIAALPAERFNALCNYLSAEEDTGQESLDVQQFAGWAKFDDKKSNAFLALAELYLKESAIMPTIADSTDFTVARALTALRLLQPSRYDSLSKEVWARCGVELLKSAFPDHMDLLDPLFDSFAARAPDAAEQALLEVISQEAEHGSVFVLQHWGARLTSSQAVAILDFARQQHTQNSIFRIISALAQSDYNDLVQVYLREVFRNGWGNPPEPEYHKLRTLAFTLSPVEYAHQVVEMLETNPDWGKSWLEFSINSDDTIFNAIKQSEIADIAAMCSWLREYYPPSTRPIHEGGYWVESIDSIYMLQDSIIRFLAQCGKLGTAAALQEIADRFPTEAWLADCVLNARTAELSQNIPELAVADIIALCDSNRKLVNTTQDLLDVLMDQIGLYEKYLQEGTRAVNDLWNSKGRALYPQPKEEEALSDHIKRYLDLTLKNNILINREVQIDRKLHKDGKAGSRTDLLVHATTSNGDSMLTVCIEVKCNWNSSAESSLQNQLINKYIANGVARGGILLLGWFDCKNWDTDDYRKRDSIKTWPTLEEARADLNKQATSEREKAGGKRVYAVAVNCTLQ